MALQVEDENLKIDLKLKTYEIKIERSIPKLPKDAKEASDGAAVNELENDGYSAGKAVANDGNWDGAANWALIAFSPTSSIFPSLMYFLFKSKNMGEKCILLLISIKFKKIDLVFCFIMLLCFNHFNSEKKIHLIYFPEMILEIEVSHWGNKIGHMN
ncbi:hypothetical protein BpHYR1_035056 [Brachionus plicatilis]|uniref:Uncharacterized protein n=1 Tax=Brachionus plicatilis TaxID=10195 RepID=A0A3M7SZA7_BRAPC|nr:hypothetical protein BpHYR1_035056 [Brachionus plicatilis]